MNSAEIDNAIRARLKELSTISDEYINLICNHLPSVANSVYWNKAVDFAVEMCNPFSSADGSSGRLYELTDQEIVSAEAWFQANKDWVEFFTAAYVNDTLFTVIDNFGLPLANPEQTVMLMDRKVSVAAIWYVGCGFPQ